MYPSAVIKSCIFLKDNLINNEVLLKDLNVLS